MISLFRWPFVLLLALMLVVSGCGKASNSTEQASPAEGQSTEKPAAEAAGGQTEAAADKPAREPVTLTFVKSSDNTLPGLEEIFKKYEEKTGNKVEVQALPGGNDFETVVKTRFATGDYPDLLLYFSGSQHYVGLRAEETLLDMTNEPFIAGMTDAARSFQTYNNKIYGLAWGSFSSIGVIYNKELFQKAGVDVPKNYADFLDICEKLKAASITPIFEAVKDAWPVQIFSLAGWETFVDPAIGPEGIEKLNKNEMKFTDIPELKDMFARQVELKEKGYLNDNLLSATYDMQQEAIGTGTAAMILQGEWVLPELRKKFGDEVVNKLGMFPIPSDTDTGIAALYAPSQILIAKDTEHVEAARELLAFMTEPESLEIWYANNPGIPVFKGVDVELSPPQQDMSNYTQNGKAEINVQFRLRPQLLEYDKITQMLIIDGNVEEAVANMSDKYIQDGKNKQYPGF